MDDLLGLDMTFVAFVRKGTSNESVISQLVVFAPPDLLMRWLLVDLFRNYDKELPNDLIDHETTVFYKISPTLCIIQMAQSIVKFIFIFFRDENYLLTPATVIASYPHRNISKDF